MSVECFYVRGVSPTHPNRKNNPKWNPEGLQNHTENALRISSDFARSFSAPGKDRHFVEWGMVLVWPPARTPNRLSVSRSVGPSVRRSVGGVLGVLDALRPRGASPRARGSARTPSARRARLPPPCPRGARTR